LIDDNLHIRLADFGLAFFADTSTASFGSHFGGAARWMSPELLTCAIMRPTYACDVYAFGCVCIEIHTRRVPFSEILKDVQVIAKVQHGARPVRPDSDHGGQSITDDLWDVVQSCWLTNPGERPAMKDIATQLRATATIQLEDA